MSRRRRAPDEARSDILDAATSLLAEGGVAAVQIRAVARRIGMTDAGVSHHVGSRRQLLEAVLADGGRRIRSQLDEVLANCLDVDLDLDLLADSLAEVYHRGYAELAVALHGAGWRDKRSGLLEPLVEALHSRRTTPGDRHDTRLAVAALHQGLALEPVYGSAFRRSAGISAGEAERPDGQRRWWVDTIAARLGIRVPGGEGDAPITTTRA
jgi:AcrR family transcriptional regulator